MTLRGQAHDRAEKEDTVGGGSVIVYAGKTLFQGDEVLLFCLSCARVRVCVRLCMYVSLCMIRVCYLFLVTAKKKGGCFFLALS